MGMYRSFHGELTCPGCGHEYKKYRPTLAEMRDHYAAYRVSVTKPMRLLDMRKHWARMDGFKSIKAWLKFVNSDAFLERERDRPWWGMVEVQTKEIGDNDFMHFYPGDLVDDTPIGHFAVKGHLSCRACSRIQRWNDVWIVIKNQHFLGLSVDEPIFNLGEILMDEIEKERKK